MPSEIFIFLSDWKAVLGTILFTVLSFELIKRLSILEFLYSDSKDNSSTNNINLTRGRSSSRLRAVIENVTYFTQFQYPNFSSKECLEEVSTVYATVTSNEDGESSPYDRQSETSTSPQTIDDLVKQVDKDFKFCEHFHEPKTQLFLEAQNQCAQTYLNTHIPDKSKFLHFMRHPYDMFQPSEIPFKKGFLYFRFQRDENNFVKLYKSSNVKERGDLILDASLLEGELIGTWVNDTGDKIVYGVRTAPSEYSTTATSSSTDPLTLSASIASEGVEVMTLRIRDVYNGTDYPDIIENVSLNSTISWFSTYLGFFYTSIESKALRTLSHKSHSDKMKMQGQSRRRKYVKSIRFHMVGSSQEDDTLILDFDDLERASNNNRISSTNHIVTSKDVTETGIAGQENEVGDEESNSEDSSLYSSLHVHTEVTSDDMFLIISSFLTPPLDTDSVNDFLNTSDSDPSRGHSSGSGSDSLTGNKVYCLDISQFDGVDPESMGLCRTLVDSFLYRYEYVTNINEQFWFRTNYRAPTHRIIRFTLLNNHQNILAAKQSSIMSGSEEQNPDNIKLVNVPSIVPFNNSLQEVVEWIPPDLDGANLIKARICHQNILILKYSRYGCHTMSIHILTSRSVDDASWTEPVTELPHPAFGTIIGPTCSFHSSEVFYMYSGFSDPGTLFHAVVLRPDRTHGIELSVTPIKQSSLTLPQSFRKSKIGNPPSFSLLDRVASDASVSSSIPQSPYVETPLETPDILNTNPSQVSDSEPTAHMESTENNMDTPTPLPTPATTHDSSVENSSSARVSDLPLPPIEIGLHEFDTVQEFVTLKDGTQMPVLLFGRRDCVYGQERDKTGPCIIYVGGGFGMTVQPYFSLAVLLFVRQYHGIFCIANVRSFFHTSTASNAASASRTQSGNKPVGGSGGDKFSSPVTARSTARDTPVTARSKASIAYSQTGQVDTGSHVTSLTDVPPADDLFDIAQFLIHYGFATPSTLGLLAGSSGSVATAMAMSRHPELFSAVVIENGVFDLKNYQRISELSTKPAVATRGLTTSLSSGNGGVVTEEERSDSSGEENDTSSEVDGVWLHEFLGPDSSEAMDQEARKERLAVLSPLHTILSGSSVASVIPFPAVLLTSSSSALSSSHSGVMKSVSGNTVDATVSVKQTSSSLAVYQVEASHSLKYVAALQRLIGYRSIQEKPLLLRVYGVDGSVSFPLPPTSSSNMNRLRAVYDDPEDCRYDETMRQTDIFTFFAHHLNATWKGEEEEDRSG